jgi:hypothetical protein
MGTNRQTDGRTDRQKGRTANMKKLTVAFRNFSSAHRKEKSSWIDDISYIYILLDLWNTGVSVTGPVWLRGLQEF